MKLFLLHQDGPEERVLPVGKQIEGCRFPFGSLSLVSQRIWGSELTILRQPKTAGKEFQSILLPSVALVSRRTRSKDTSRSDGFVAPLCEIQRFMEERE
jgi:hypothetical protein